MEIPERFAADRVEASASLRDLALFPQLPQLDLDQSVQLFRRGTEADVSAPREELDKMRYTLHACRASSLEEAIGSMRECPELSSPPSDSEEGRVPFLRSLAKLKDSKAKKLVIGILLPKDGRALADTIENVLSELDPTLCSAEGKSLQVLICIVTDSAGSSFGEPRLGPSEELKAELGRLGLWSDALLARHEGFATEEPPPRHGIGVAPRPPGMAQQLRDSTASLRRLSEVAGAGRGEAAAAPPSASPPSRSRFRTRSSVAGAEDSLLADGMGSRNLTKEGLVGSRVLRRVRFQRVLHRNHAADHHDDRHAVWVSHRPVFSSRVRGRPEFHRAVNLACVVERHTLDLHTASLWIRHLVAWEIGADFALMIQGGSTFVYRGLTRMLRCADLAGVGAVTPATQVRVTNACDGFNPAFACDTFHRRASDLVYRIPSSLFGYCHTLPETCYLLNLTHVNQHLARGATLDHPPARRTCCACGPARALALYAPISGTRCLANSIALRAGMRIVHVPRARVAVPGRTRIVQAGLERQVRAGAVLWGLVDATLSLGALWRSRQFLLAKPLISVQILLAWPELLLLAVAPGLSYVALRASLDMTLARSSVSSLRWIGEMTKFSFLVLLVFSLSLSMRARPRDVGALHMLIVAFFGALGTGILGYTAHFAARHPQELSSLLLAAVVGALQLCTALHEHVTTLVVTAPQSLMMGLGALVGGSVHALLNGGRAVNADEVRSRIPEAEAAEAPQQRPWGSATTSSAPVLSPTGRARAVSGAALAPPAHESRLSSYVLASDRLDRYDSNLTVLWLVVNVAVVAGLSSSVVAPADALRTLMLALAGALLPRLAMAALVGVWLRLSQCCAREHDTAFGADS